MLSKRTMDQACPLPVSLNYPSRSFLCSIFCPIPTVCAEILVQTNKCDIVPVDEPVTDQPQGESLHLTVGHQCVYVQRPSSSDFS